MGRISDDSPRFESLVTLVIFALIIIIAGLTIIPKTNTSDTKFGILIALIGLGAVAFIIIRKH